MRETPQFHNTSYSNMTYTGDTVSPVQEYTTGTVKLGKPDFDAMFKKLGAGIDAINELNEEAERDMSKTGRRIVEIYIIDPDENVPLAQCVLHEGKAQLTDLTDEELFFEIPIAERLKTHNETRLTILNKKATERAGREIFLEKIRVRDLAMTVVTKAEF